MMTEENQAEDKPRKITTLGDLFEKSDERALKRLREFRELFPRHKKTVKKEKDSK